MRILIAPDSFKDALTALEVAEAIAEGLTRAMPSAAPQLFPLGDGGEGTSSILTYHNSGRIVELPVSDPLGRPHRARYGLSGDGRVAYIEMAQASGLQLLNAPERDPMVTSTYGTGEMILDAARRGVNEIVLCIGGSATNDMGTGMAAALGYRFEDAEGRLIERPAGKDLLRIASIGKEELLFDPRQIRTTVLCDVDNPLYGPKGAAFVYGAQKGAGEQAIIRLDRGMRQFAALVEAHFGRAVADVPGSGAAGGLGAGSLAFLGASLEPGIELVMRLTGFEDALRKSDLVITGEGRIDGQTLHGKLIHGICRRAAVYGLPVWALCGRLDAGPGQLRAIGLKGAFPVSPVGMPLTEALALTRDNLVRMSAGEAFCRALFGSK